MVIRLLGFVLISLLVGACTSLDPPSSTKSSTPGTIQSSLPENINTQDRYLFYLHGKIIEIEGTDAVSPQFGTYEFAEILQYLADAGYEVIGEVRTSPTDVTDYAGHVAEQVRDLLRQGVPDRNITIVGFSKGAGISILISTMLHNPDLNFALLAICGEEITSSSGLDLSGRILSLYENSDPYGSSCEQLVERSSGVTDFTEIAFNTGKSHGAFYTADPAWLDPLISWIDEVLP